MMKLSKPNTALFTLLCIAFLGLPACSKSKPNRVTIEKHCYDKIMASVNTNSLNLIERKYFKDGRSRGILKAEQIKATKFSEGSSSATASNYMQEFGFHHANGKKVTLVRSPETGGISMTEPNIVSPNITCTVIWGMFKGKVMKDSIKTTLISVNDLQQRFQTLDTNIE